MQETSPWSKQTRALCDMQCVQNHAEATSIHIKIKNKTASYGLQNEKLRLFIFLISSQMQCLTADLQRVSSAFTFPRCRQVLSIPLPPGVAVLSSHAGANTEALLGLEMSLQEQQRARAKARLPPHPGADHEQMPREGEDFVFPAVLTLPEFGWLTETRLSTIGNKTHKAMERG